jgi:hypothetical protein
MSFGRGKGGLKRGQEWWAMKRKMATKASDALNCVVSLYIKKTKHGIGIYMITDMI